MTIQAQNKFRQYAILIIFLNFMLVVGKAQSLSEDVLYEEAYTALTAMLEGETEASFSEAVFITENAYLNGELYKSEYDRIINSLVRLTNGIRQNSTLEYPHKDKEIVEKYSALFTLMTDTQTVIVERDTFYHFPYTYNFDDVFGDRLWQNMFVSKLIDTGKGNCHSLPYLYKILADQIGVEAHLALAPNHVYIKQRCEKAGWYNTELTSASFPIDAWLMASGYIHLDAIRNGAYMKALTNEESIAMCVIDLAMGYDRKFPENDGLFVLQCCDLALTHFPNYINALLLQAETKQRQVKQMMEQYQVQYPKELFPLVPASEAIWKEMESIYLSIHQLGYRQMPKQMYLDWLVSLKEEREKYQNRKVTSFGEK